MEDFKHDMHQNMAMYSNPCGRFVGALIAAARFVADGNDAPSTLSSFVKYADNPLQSAPNLESAGIEFSISCTAVADLYLHVSEGCSCSFQMFPSDSARIQSYPVTSVEAATFALALSSEGNSSIEIPILGLLAKSALLSRERHSKEISDSDALTVLCAYYCSCDSLFASVFSPNQLYVLSNIAASKKFLLSAMLEESPSEAVSIGTMWQELNRDGAILSSFLDCNEDIAARLEKLGADVRRTPAIVKKSECMHPIDTTWRTSLMSDESSGLYPFRKHYGKAVCGDVADLIVENISVSRPSPVSCIDMAEILLSYALGSDAEPCDEPLLRFVMFIKKVLSHRISYEPLKTFLYCNEPMQQLLLELSSSDIRTSQVIPSFAIANGIYECAPFTSKRIEEQYDFSFCDSISLSKHLKDEAPILSEKSMFGVFRYDIAKLTLAISGYTALFITGESDMNPAAIEADPSLAGNFICEMPCFFSSTSGTTGRFHQKQEHSTGIGRPHRPVPRARVSVCGFKTAFASSESAEFDEFCFWFGKNGTIEEDASINGSNEIVSSAISSFQNNTSAEEIPEKLSSTWLENKRTDSDIRAFKEYSSDPVDPLISMAVSVGRTLAQNSPRTTEWTSDENEARFLTWGFLFTYDMAMRALSENQPANKLLFPTGMLATALALPLPNAPHNKAVNNEGVFVCNEDRCLKTEHLREAENQPDVRAQQYAQDTWFPESSRFTPMLARFASDLTVECISAPKLVERDEVVASMETILSRKSKSNIMLLGEAGTGKSALVENLAMRIRKNECCEELKNNRVYQIDLSAIAAQGIPGMNFLETMMKEAAESRTILFIDEAHMLSDTGSRELNAMNIMKPFLARDDVSVICATTNLEYSATLHKDKAFDRRFSVVRVPELTFEQIEAVLSVRSREFAEYHSVNYPETMLKMIVRMSNEYVPSRHSPDRELDILDISGTIAKKRGSTVVEEPDIYEAIRTVSSNPSIKMFTMDEETDTVFFPKVAGQKKAKESLIRRLALVRAGFSPSDAPKCILMFCGPSGVGKTLTALSVADVLDIQKQDVLTIPMNEYSSKVEVSRLVGGSPNYVGYREGGVLTNFAAAHPSGLLILDEIDKASQSVIDYMLGMFDTGFIESGAGEKIDCRSLVVIMTSNIESAVKTPLGFGSVVANDDTDIKKELISHFGSPFVGRIDEIIRFSNLSKEDLADMLRINYENFNEECIIRFGIDFDSISEINVKNEIASLVSKTEDATGARAAWKELESKLKFSLLENKDVFVTTEQKDYTSQKPCKHSQGSVFCLQKNSDD